jgi:putative NADH-flavin reductase
MKEKSKIAVIGSSGNAGNYLIKEVINQGYDFKALVRDPDKFQAINASVEIITGNVKDYSTVLSLIGGCDAVISTLGLGQPNSETFIFSQSTKNVIRAMQECNVQRYIVITGLNVDTPNDQKSTKTEFATNWMKTNYPLTTADKQLEFNELSKSDINWTLVRLPLIDQTEERGKVSVSTEDCLGEKISATDLAYFLIEQLESDLYLKKAPFIANV